MVYSFSVVELETKTSLGNLEISAIVGDLSSCLLSLDKMPRAILQSANSGQRQARCVEKSGRNSSYPIAIRDPPCR